MSPNYIFELITSKIHIQVYKLPRSESYQWVSFKWTMDNGL